VANGTMRSAGRSIHDHGGRIRPRKPSLGHATASAAGD